MMFFYRDVDYALRLDGDALRTLELARGGTPFAAPLEQQLADRRQLLHTIAIAVGDVNVPNLIDGDAVDLSQGERQDLPTGRRLCRRQGRRQGRKRGDDGIEHSPRTPHPPNHRDGQGENT